jgi:hypothetical protein
MKKVPLLLVSMLLFGCTMVVAQNGIEPRPGIVRMPEIPRVGPMQSEDVQKPTASPQQLRKDAEALVTLSQSVLSDVGQVNKGLLPKDIDKKLKQIEKLSRQLRREVSR